MIKTDTVMSAQNARIVQDYFEAVWEDNTYREDLLAPDYVAHLQSDEEATLEERRARTAAFHEAFPDIDVEVEDVIATEEKAVLRYRATGTHEDEIMGIPATGNEVDVVGVGIFAVEDGRITEAWYVDDYLGFMRQLGVVD